MKVSETSIPGVLVVRPTVHGDARGYFLESWHRDRYAAAGVGAAFVQDNVSRSSRGILRGLHLQEPDGQGKLVQVLFGEVFDVAVDVRVGSPTFGQWAGFSLSDVTADQVYLPAGIAHGFCVISEMAVFEYKCTAFYRREAEIGIAWNDPDLGIQWPIGDPILSHKDATAPRLADIPRDRLPRWRDG